MTGLLADEAVALAEQLARRVLAGLRDRATNCDTQLAILRRLARVEPAMWWL